MPHIESSTATTQPPGSSPAAATWERNSSSARRYGSGAGFERGVSPDATTARK